MTSVDKTLKAVAEKGGKVGKTPMPGVEVHANAIHSLLENSWIRIVSAKYIIQMIIAVAVLSGIVFYLGGVPTWAAAATTPSCAAIATTISEAAVACSAVAVVEAAGVETVVGALGSASHIVRRV